MRLWCGLACLAIFGTVVLAESTSTQEPTSSSSAPIKIPIPVLPGQVPPEAQKRDYQPGALHDQKGAYTQGGDAGSTGYYYYYYPVKAEDAGGHVPPSLIPGGLSFDPIHLVTAAIVLGLLVFGLFFIFPSILGLFTIQIGNGSQTARTDGSPSPLNLRKEEVGKLTTAVLAALESRECGQRLVCEAGRMARKVKSADAFLRIVEDYGPTVLAPTVKSFRSVIQSEEDCHIIKCRRLEKD